MDLDFLRDHGARRLTFSVDQPPLLDLPDEDEEGDESSGQDGVILNVEEEPGAWEARDVVGPSDWHPDDWAERPVRFIDGKDVGRTVAWLRAPGGQPIPVRLSEIGSAAVRVDDGVCRREFATVERVVSFIVDPFEWDQIEAFGDALQEHGFRLLPTRPPKGALSFDFEVMRKAAQNRSYDEMGVLEEAALGQDDRTPTIVDGRLEPRTGGFDQHSSPVVGVIKTHSKNYLHVRGLRLLYELEAGERTPMFVVTNEQSSADSGGGNNKAEVPAADTRKNRLPVVSWYVRLTGARGMAPNWGIVRVELPLRWFEQRDSAARTAYADLLSRFLCTYRCRDTGYDRAAVSLHPIVRAEQLLGALFTPHNTLAQRFFRLTGL